MTRESEITVRVRFPTEWRDVPAALESGRPPGKEATPLPMEGWRFVEGRITSGR